jgi:hypothetical protein
MSTDSMDTSFLEEERRARDEVETFEELEKQFASTRHGIRVKFASSSDDDRLVSMTKTTVIKTEPCFQVNASEDQVTKHFYKNEVSSKNETTQTNNIQYTSPKTPSEPDSLEEVYRKMTDLPDQFSSSVPGKSILKKPQKKPERSSISRSPSPSSLKKKQTSLTRLDSNEVQHLQDQLFGIPFQINIIAHLQGKHIEDNIFHGHLLEIIFTKEEIKLSNHLQKSK